VHCDHIGHMNVMWYVGKFDGAIWNLFARIGLAPTYLRESGREMAAVQQNITHNRADAIRRTAARLIASPEPVEA
jgi:acyl-CoA thioester hydrolase